jgi:hypothetical protein
MQDYFSIAHCQVDNYNEHLIVLSIQRLLLVINQKIEGCSEFVLRSRDESPRALRACDTAERLVHPFPHL